MASLKIPFYSPLKHEVRPTIPNIQTEQYQEQGQTAETTATGPPVTAYISS